MKARCSNPNGQEFHNYGGRGIAVCDRWQNSFESFFADMSEGFFEGAEIDRKDTNGNYEPGNCRWVTDKEQQRNKRTNHLLTIGEETMTLIEWEEKTGIKANTILIRIRRGWPKSRLLEIANEGDLRT
jgi:hypothetical protein